MQFNFLPPINYLRLVLFNPHFFSVPRNAELQKKEHLLSDDEFERELELGDFSSLGSDEEIDDDDLLLELEEAINS